MGINRKIVWVAALAAQVGMLAASEPESRPGGDRTQLRIKVYVSNYAQVPGTVLAQARQQVQGIYRAAGVEAEWVDCPRVAEESREYPDCRPDGSRQDWVALRLISQSMIGGLRLDPSTFGLAAVPEDGGFGNWALVCSECAEPLTRGRRHFYGPILGALMAHEIGHLLLATTRHSAFGLMHSQWNRTELKEAAQGQMFFTAKEAQRIRAQVRERMRHTTQMAKFASHSGRLRSSKLRNWSLPPKSFHE